MITAHRPSIKHKQRKGKKTMKLENRVDELEKWNKSNESFNIEQIKVQRNIDFE